MYHNESKYTTCTSEYRNAFWNHIRGAGGTPLLDEALVVGYGYLLPDKSNSAMDAALTKESLFRRIGSVMRAYGNGYRILAKDSKDLAMFVPENGELPILEGVDDFTITKVDSHKLATFFKFDEDFIRDAAFDMEKYLISRLAKNFGMAEEKAFVSGDGVEQPIGILADEGGAEIGATAAQLTYDDVIRLFFSVKPEHRRKGVWLMNDETALTLRTMKDKDGNYIWNHANDTILGKPVEISNEMPNAESGKKPIAFGDFSYYWVIPRTPVNVKPITELFAEDAQIAYLAFEFLDGKLIRHDAVKVLQIGT